MEETLFTIEKLRFSMNFPLLYLELYIPFFRNSLENSGFTAVGAKSDVFFHLAAASFFSRRLPRSKTPPSTSGSYHRRAVMNVDISTTIYFLQLKLTALYPARAVRKHYLQNSLSPIIPFNEIRVIHITDSHDPLGKRSVDKFVPADIDAYMGCPWLIGCKVH